MGFTVKKGSEKGSQNGVLRRGVSRRCLERPHVEYALLGVRPIHLFKIKGREGGVSEEAVGIEAPPGCLQGRGDQVFFGGVGGETSTKTLFLSAGVALNSEEKN